jgi:hypothetical protein
MAHSILKPRVKKAEVEKALLAAKKPLSLEELSVDILISRCDTVNTKSWRETLLRVVELNCFKLSLGRTVLASLKKEELVATPDGEFFFSNK